MNDDLLFQFIKKSDLGTDPLIAVISESMIQSHSEANFGRELSDTELQRVYEQFYDDESVADSLTQAIHFAIEKTFEENSENETS